MWIHFTLVVGWWPVINETLEGLMEEWIPVNFSKFKSKCDTVGQETEADKRLASTTGQ